MSKFNLKESKRRYLEEYEKYKEVPLVLNEAYLKKTKHSEKVQITKIDEEAQLAIVENLRTGNTQIKTLHWCRKNLIKDEE
jgi:pyruvate-formate lyase